MCEKSVRSATGEEVVVTVTDSGQARRPLSREVVAGFLWCSCSFGMVVTNKLLLSSFEFNAPFSLLFFQFLIVVVLVDLSAALGMMERAPLEWRVLKLWWPVNVVFVAMICTGFLTLKHLQIPMVTLLKNLTNILSIVGDLLFFDKRYALGVWASLALMTLSAGVGAVTDLQFDAVGYAWMCLNCVCTAGYTLYLKHVLNQVDQVLSKGGLSDISKVYYNHFLGLPWLLICMICSGEGQNLLGQPAMQHPQFLAAVAVSGVVGFCLSFWSIRFMAATTVTTYVMVGSFNKIPTAVLGWIIFRVRTSLPNVASVLVGLCAGMVFVRAKMNSAG